MCGLFKSTLLLLVETPEKAMCQPGLGGGDQGGISYQGLSGDSIGTIGRVESGKTPHESTLQLYI